MLRITRRCTNARSRVNSRRAFVHLRALRACKFFLVVGVARFELAALRSRTVRATKLRYTPIVVFSCFVSSLEQECSLLFGSASRAHRRFCCRAVRSAFLPRSRCIVFSLPLPYATQTALHPDSGIQLFCFIPRTGMFTCVVSSRVLKGTLNNISNIPPRCQGIRPACRGGRAKH